MAHVRGLNETSGLGTLHTGRPKCQPGKLTTKFARLDHQRLLLRRQLAVWTEKQQVTRRRLGVVEKEMAQIGRLIHRFDGQRRAANGRARAARIAPCASAEDGAAAAPQRSDIDLEY